jgi:hypothetical protein
MNLAKSLCSVKVSFMGSVWNSKHQMHITSNQYIQVNNIWGWSVIMPCACQLLLLFAFVLYMVRAVNKFDFRLFIN